MSWGLDALCIGLDALWKEWHVSALFEVGNKSTNKQYVRVRQRERERESTPNGGRTPGTGKRTHREMFAAMCKRISGPLKRHAAWDCVSFRFWSILYLHTEPSSPANYFLVHDHDHWLQKDCPSSAFYIFYRRITKCTEDTSKPRT